jgi:hypothetical protein
MTNETLLLRKTRKDIEKRQTANRYEQACSVVVEIEKGRYFDTATIIAPSFRSTGHMAVSIGADYRIWQAAGSVRHSCWRLWEVEVEVEVVE